MYINTANISIDINYTLSNTATLRCPSYSKILHVHMRSGNLIITYSSNVYVNTNNFIDPGYKIFEFLVSKGLYNNNVIIKDGFEYFDSSVNYYYIYILFLIQRLSID